MPLLALWILWMSRTAGAFSTAMIIVLYGLVQSNKMLLFKANQFHLLLHAMPIPRPTIVKSVFTYAFFSNCVVVAITLPIHYAVTAAHEEAFAFSVAVTTLMFATALMHYCLLTDEDYDLSTTTIFLTTFLSGIVASILQAVFSVFAAFTWFQLGSAPVISCVVFFIIMQRTVKQYEQRLSY